MTFSLVYDEHKKVFTPLDGGCKPSPEYSSSFLNQILLVWFDSTVWRSKNKSIDKKDLWDLNAEDRWVRTLKNTIKINFCRKKLYFRILLFVKGYSNYLFALIASKLWFLYGKIYGLKHKNFMKKTILIPNQGLVYLTASSKHLGFIILSVESGSSDISCSSSLVLNSWMF